MAEEPVLLRRISRTGAWVPFHASWATGLPGGTSFVGVPLNGGVH